MVRRFSVVFFLLVVTVTATAVLNAQPESAESDECLLGAHFLEAINLADVSLFAEDYRPAAEVVQDLMGEEAAAFWVTVTWDGANAMVFHLWHESAFLPENCNMLGNPGGQCRDVHVDLDSLEVVGTFFWQ